MGRVSNSISLTNMDPYTLEQLDTTEPQGFHAVMRFLRVLNRHRMILIALVSAGAVLGFVHFKRIPKQYQSASRLMIRQVSTDPKTQTSKAVQGVLASYRQLLLSDRVLNETAQQLDKLPPELAGQSDRILWPEVLRSMLTVTFEADQHVLDIACRSTQPEATVAVIEALRMSSEKFMEDYQKDLSIELMEQLKKDRQSVEKQLKDKERELLDRRRSCGDIAINEGADQSHPLVQRVSHLNEQLTVARSRRLQLQSALVSARNLVASGADLTAALQKLATLIGSAAGNQIPALAAVDPEPVRKLRAEVKSLETELATLRRHYGRGHAEIARREADLQSRQTRLAQMDNDLRRRISVGIRDPEVGAWLISTLENELAVTSAHEHTLQQEYVIVEREAMDLSNQLASIQLAEREVEALSELRTSLLNRLNSINIDQSGGRFRVAALSEPLMPGNPSYPVLTHILGLFCIVAAALGVGVIYVIDLMDDRLRSPEEVREELGLPVLGIIRKLPDEEVEQARIYVHDFPQTPHAECFRSLKTAVTLSAMDTKCLAITSTEASEGKTTTTVNLAASYAQTGKRTLLIDADMRRPGLSRLLEVRAQGGLSEILRAESDIPEMCRERIVQTDVPLLEVLPCGPRILNAGMLLSMPSLADILDWAVSEYDQVIVDCPPTLPVSDAAIVGRFVDGMLFLMNPDKTHRRSVARAVDQLRSMGLKIVGIVANTSLSEDNSSYGYQYGYGYSSDYSYGHDEELEGEGLAGILNHSDQERAA